METFKNKLQTKINNAGCNDDLQSIIRHIDLDQLKHFLNNKIEENTVTDLKSIYFKSSSIIDIFGIDIIKHYSNYLSIHELYKYQIICKTFEKINKSLLSSDEYINNFMKTNQTFRNFKQWLTNREKQDYDKELFKLNVAVFHLIENYSKQPDIEELKGEDLISLKCINKMGFEVNEIKRISQHDTCQYGTFILQGLDDDDCINVENRQDYQEYITSNVGWTDEVDESKLEQNYAKIGRYTVEDVPDAGTYTEDLYYGFFVTVARCDEEEEEGEEVNEGECIECGNFAKGKIYETDGLFYCLECWEKYESI